MPRSVTTVYRSIDSDHLLASTDRASSDSMRTLIVLLSIVAVANGEGCASVFNQQCINETKQLKKCFFHQVKEITAKNFEQLKQFGEEAKKCYEIEGVKGICNLPAHPTHPPPPPQSQRKQFAECINGTKQVFVSCFKGAMGIPEDCHLPSHHGHEANKSGFQHHFFHISPAQVNQSILESCGGNQAAADKIYGCGKNAAKPYFLAIAATMFPMISVCQAKDACIQQNQLSSECKEQMQKGRQAFCQCLPKTKEYLKTSDQCASVREAFANHTQIAHEQANEASEGHQDHPDHPELNPCENENFCQDLQQKLQKYQAAYEKGGQVE